MPRQRKKGGGGSTGKPPPGRFTFRLTPERRNRLDLLAEILHVQGKTDGTKADVIHYLLGNLPVPRDNHSPAPVPEGLRQKYEVVAKIMFEARWIREKTDAEIIGGLVDLVWEGLKDTRTLDAFLKHGSRGGG